MAHKAIIARQDVEPLPAVDATICTRDEVKRLIAESGGGVGPQGPPGPQGPAGPQGESVVVQGSDNIMVSPSTVGDLRTYTVALTEPVEFASGDQRMRAMFYEKGVNVIDEGDPSTSNPTINTELRAGTLTGLTNTTWDPTGVVPDRAATEGQLQEIAQPGLQSSGNWLYRISGNWFEAVYTETNKSMAVTEGSGNFYRTAAQTLLVPAAIRNNQTLTPKYVSVFLGHSGYPVTTALETIIANGFTWFGVSGSTRNQTGGYYMTAKIEGILT